MDTGVRSSGSSNMAALRSNGSSSARSASTVAVSLETGSSASSPVSPWPWPASGAGACLRLADLRGHLLQERILLELLPDHLLQLERRQLQELDGLLEERCHDDPLRLTESRASWNRAP